MKNARRHFLTLYRFIIGIDLDSEVSTISALINASVRCTFSIARVWLLSGCASVRRKIIDCKYRLLIRAGNFTPTGLTVLSEINPTATGWERETEPTATADWFARLQSRKCGNLGWCQT